MDGNISCSLPGQFAGMSRGPYVAASEPDMAPHPEASEYKWSYAPPSHPRQSPPLSTPSPPPTFASPGSTHITWAKYVTSTPPSVPFLDSLGQRTDSYLLKFISSRGNEYFCEIDEEYLTDRFNLTGLNTEVHYYQHALDLITDVFDLDCEDDMREAIEKSARHLYGLVHARYIVTTRGLAKMVDKYKKCDFGRCPRVMCEGQGLLPMGQSDLAGQKAVRLYCARCEDLYNPKSSKHASIDGAYFGTSFHSMLFQVYPALIPTKSRRRYEPKIFGFKVHAAAALGRWQDEFRRSERLKLMEAGVGVSDVPVEYTSVGTGGGGVGAGAGAVGSAGSGVSAGASAGAGVNVNTNTNTSDAEPKPTMKVQKLFVEDEESDDGMGEVEEEAREKKRVAERRAAALAALVAAQREKQTQHSGLSGQSGQGHAGQGHAGQGHAGQGQGQGHGNGGGQARGMDVEDVMDDRK